MKNQKDEHKVVLIETWNGGVKIKEDEIIYIKCDGQGVIIFTTQKKEIHSPRCLEIISDILGAIKFCRIHRSYIINLKYVSSYRRSDLKLFLDYNFGSTCLVIARRRYNYFLEAFKDYYKIQSL